VKASFNLNHRNRVASNSLVQESLVSPYEKSLFKSNHLVSKKIEPKNIAI